MKAGVLHCRDHCSPLSSFSESEGEGKDQSADEQEENCDLHDMQV